MEEDAQVKSSVAQLAGKLKGHALPMPGLEVKSMRTPCSLVINNQKDEEHEEMVSICPHPPKLKIKSSPLIEKLQANLALSPTVLLSPPKSPESKQTSTACSPISPCSSLSSTLQPTQLSCEDEAPVSFEQPFEGTPLPSINKSRARLSFKRRLPTRQHRKSACEETKWNDDSPCEPDSQQQNGDEGELYNGPSQEDTEDKTDYVQPTNGLQQEKDRTEHLDATQENEGTEVTHVGSKEEVTEGGYEPSDSKQAQEEEKEETREDRTEVKEDKEVLDEENNPE
ncbi:capZ-interacting protein isoform X1 [Carassius gibelio]|uniref:capZ-interacting protein isoform X1 n=2 Tax=Carassius gibelio TaxID=101364 RepID=UPI002278BBCC|nr:capZ-interacting protein isoform X1 [Carassius gibelio]XP_052473187.1 capZ-interacting protein isoform X1 [Carassius gibelio]